MSRWTGRALPLVLTAEIHSEMPLLFLLRGAVLKNTERDLRNRAGVRVLVHHRNMTLEEMRSLCMTWFAHLSTGSFAGLLGVTRWACPPGASLGLQCLILVAVPGFIS